MDEACYTTDMKPILIIQNVTREHAGLIEEVLKQKAIPFQIVDLSQQPTADIVLANYCGVVMMGGPDSANDTTAKMQTALHVAQQALSSELPYLGICLGEQVLVKAGGGRVVRSPVKEIGWNYEIHLTPEGQADHLFAGLPETIPVFQLHGEMAEPTDRMMLLAKGDICPIQVVKVGKLAYGLQCHLELTDELYQIWLDQDPDLKQLDRSNLEQHWQTVRDEYTRHGKQLINNWLNQFSS